MRLHEDPQGSEDMLAVLLIVEDAAKGHRLAYRYPESLKQGASEEGSEKASARTLEFLCGDSDGKTLARLLRPKERIMCDQSFQLAIDDVLFVGHPMTIAPRYHATAASTSTSRPEAASGGAGTGSAVPARQPLSNARPEAAAPSLGHMASSGLGTSSDALPRSVSTQPTVGEECARPPAGGHIFDQPESAVASAVANDVMDGQDNITFFNVVFALDNSAALGSTPTSGSSPTALAQALSSTSLSAVPISTSPTRRRRGQPKSRKRDRQRRVQDGPFVSSVEEAASALAHALKFEEIHRGYITAWLRHRGAGPIPIARENLENTSSSIDGKELRGISSSIDHSEEDDSTSASLATVLHEVHKSLVKKQFVHTCVNGWVTVTVKLSQQSALSASPVSQAGDPSPYHTLLLLQDEQALEQELPPDSSYQLTALIRAANPLRSFRELSVSTGIPLQHVHRLAKHLTFWGKARIIDTVLTSNVYRVASNSISRASPALRESFRTKFDPRRTLFQTLALFGRGQPLSQLLASTPKDRQLLLIHTVVWMLQHRLLEQVHQYIYTLHPQPSPIAHVSDGLIEVATESPSGGVALPPPRWSPAHLHRHPELSARGTSDPGPHSADDEVSILYHRICDRLARHVPGRAGARVWHGERVMDLLWHENITREDLDAVLAAFPENLVLCWHSDSEVTGWCQW